MKEWSFISRAKLVGWTEFAENWIEASAWETKLSNKLGSKIKITHIGLSTSRRQCVYPIRIVKLFSREHSHVHSACSHRNCLPTERNVISLSAFCVSTTDNQNRNTVNTVQIELYWCCLNTFKYTEKKKLQVNVTNIPV